MRALTLYMDNSVLGGYFDDEFSEATRALWKLAQQGHYRFVASVVTAQEAALAPHRVVQLFEQTFPNDTQLLAFTSRSRELAEAYVKAGVVTEKYADDARHVSIATTHGIGLIVSWNFHHLVNYHRETHFNQINTEFGYPILRIVSPQELIYDNENENI